MLGIHTGDPEFIGHFNWWIWNWLRLFDSSIGILSFGYLLTTWDMRWFTYCFNKKEKL